MGICPGNMSKRRRRYRCSEEDKENEISEFLNECIKSSASKFDKIARHIVFAILASAWATVITVKTPRYRAFLFVVVLIAMIYLASELLHCYIMERISRKIHIELLDEKLSKEEARKFFNIISNTTSGVLLLRLVLICVMVLLLAIYYSLTFSIEGNFL